MLSMATISRIYIDGHASHFSSHSIHLNSTCLRSNNSFTFTTTRLWDAGFNEAHVTTFRIRMRVCSTYIVQSLLMFQMETFEI
jgi:hypothetical protein